MRKPKPKTRQGILTAKPARNRRSTEQMLVELKQRLREISDLTAAGDILTWHQATYMPRGGADTRAVNARRSMVWRTSRQSRRHSANCSTRLPTMARGCRAILTTPVLSVLHAATLKR